MIYELRMWTALKAIEVLMFIVPPKDEGLIVLNHILAMLMELGRSPRKVVVK